MDQLYNTQKSALMSKVDEIRISYQDFFSAVNAEDEKSRDHSSGFLRRIFGSYVSNPRNHLCDIFFEKVKEQVKQLVILMEQASAEEQNEVSEALAKLMLQPRSRKSNNTQDLMYRAMVSQFIPFLPYLSLKTLELCKSQMNAAYRSIDLLPVEKDLLQKLDVEIKKRV